MYPLSRATSFGIALVAASMLAACASMKVDSFLSREADFGRYRSYTWAAPDRLSTGDPRLDNNPFFQKRLQSDVDRHLAAKGFEKQPATSPDLVVHFHASLTQQIDVNGVDRVFGQCETPECQPSVYEAGTIVIDLVDTRTNKLVWRGWASDNLDGVIDNQDWLEQKIDQAVVRIMDRLPRSPLGAPRS